MADCTCGTTTFFCATTYGGSEPVLSPRTPLTNQTAQPRSGLRAARAQLVHKCQQSQSDKQGEEPDPELSDRCGEKNHGEGQGKGNAADDEGVAAVGFHGDAPGRPQYMAELKRRAAGRPVFFHGAYQRPALGEIMGHLDLVVVPSIWPENAPLIVQEALLARVPVLASDIGALREFVTPEENGLLFRAADADALEAALQRVLAEPGLVARWSDSTKRQSPWSEIAGICLMRFPVWTTNGDTSVPSE